MKVLVIIPAHDEAPRIGPVVAGARGQGYAVVVVDDGSDDCTGDAARAAGARVLRHRCCLGYGAALETGFCFALRHGYDAVVTLDGDGQHDPASIPSLLDALTKGDGADVVLGSRELGRRAGLLVESPPLARRWGRAVLRRIASALTGRELTDPTTGYLALHSRALEFLTSGRYPHDYPDADVLVMMIRAGLRVTEAPIAVLPRSGGVSMHGGWKPVYYMFKMSVSLLLTPLRREKI